MWLLVLALCTLVSVICGDSPSCSKYQVSFESSCYEFVKFERTFQSAESWCERGGGHLVFIDQQKTQDFLAKHLLDNRDWWIGLVGDLQAGNDTHEESMVWLDTTNISYSYWDSSQPATYGKCGYLTKETNYRWRTTDNCTQELYFICQFETGRTIACENNNATVQCGSGKVVQISDSFYGRKSPHFCTSEIPLQMANGCTWTNVRDLVAGQCHGLQACQVAMDATVFGAPCPNLGSYLSINYYCMEGLQLDLVDRCVVFENVTLTVKWLLTPYTGNLSCIISLGDGQSIDPYQPENASSMITYSFTSPGEFAVFVECSTSEWHVTAQETITVEENNGSLSITGCYSKYDVKEGFCRTKYGETLWIQVDMNAGNHLNYSLIANNVTLIEFSAITGDACHNLTLDAVAQNLLGPGVHQIHIMESNSNSKTKVNNTIILHLVEAVSGLQGHLSNTTVEAGKELLINVSVSHGAPLELTFVFQGSDKTFNHTRDYPTGLPTMYNIPVNVEGTYSITVVATNAFYNISQDIGNVTVVDNDTQQKVNQDKTGPKAEKSRDTVKRRQMIQIEPGRHVNPFTIVTLHWPNLVSYNISWSCGACWPEWFDCVQQNVISTNLQQVLIPRDCLPPPSTAFTIKADVTLSDMDSVQDEQCVYVKEKALYVVLCTLTLHTSCLSCKKNCKEINVNEDLEFTASCDSCKGVKYNWYIDGNFPVKTVPLPAACNLRDFRRNALILLQSNTSDLVLNSTFLKSQSEAAFRIKLIAMNSEEYGEETMIISTLPAPEVPSCSIHPSEGSVLTRFQISCSSPCSLTGSCSKDERMTLTYCIFPKPNSQLYCGPSLDFPSVYLPLGEEEHDFVVNVTVLVTSNFGHSVNTTVKAKVKHDETNANRQILASYVAENSRNILKKGPTGSSLIQLYKSVSSVLNQEMPAFRQNSSWDHSQSELMRMTLREIMLTTLSAVNVTSLQTALEMSEVLKDLTWRSEELSASAQVEASGSLKDVSGSLLTMSDESDQTRKDAVNHLFNAVSNVLEATASNGSSHMAEPGGAQNTVSLHLLSAVENLQSALLIGKLPDNEPIILTTPSATMYINRLQTDHMDGASVNIQDSKSAAFTLPPLSSLSFSTESNDAMDLRMVSFSVNPFPSSGTLDVSGSVGGLSLTSTNGTVIPVKNLDDYIEIILPRGSPVGEVKTVLNLDNFTTLLINVTSVSIPLVFYLEPSRDVPFFLYLGYEYYPNETNYDITTYMANVEGNSYSWVISPEDLFLGEGTYYLTVKPDLDEDKASKSNLTIAITSFMSQCVFWDEVNQDWNNTGCKVGPKTTPTSTHCVCNHLTFFGSSFIVMPNAIDVTKTVELFATFVDNPVVVTTVGCIAVLYVMVLIWARRKDIQDNAKVKVIALEDNDPFAQYRYLVTIFTGHRRGAATTSKVAITLYGSEGESEPHHLYDPDGAVFERGGSDIFLITTLFPLGELMSIRLWHDNSGDKPSWYVNRVLVHDMEMDQKWYVLCNSWLSIEVGDCVLDKVFTIATEEDMKQFSNLFFMKTSKGFRDGHIWYSVFNRSPRSPFTRVQRVSCCFSLLLCTMLTSIMFWGVPTDPAEQKMDLGKIEFTWQEVMIGFESSLLMFPINLLIVQIFRHIRPRQSKDSTDKEKDKVSMPPASRRSPPEIFSSSLTSESVIKDIRKIASSLFKTQKTALPDINLAETVDINSLLSLVEDIVLRQNRVGQDFYEEGKKKDQSLILSLGSVNLQDETRSPSPEQRVNARPPRCDQSRYLYHQLQQVERKMEFLGPHQFQNRQSYGQAISQVQHMKEILENRIHSTSSASEICSSMGSLSEDGKKNATKGLPWWFVFIGWFLVASTSGVSGFFTMLYGLHYGKDSSIKWLISMAISFFESLFITQPLKVLGFAAFFALVLKKVEPEDEEETSLDGPMMENGNPNPFLESRRDSNIYQPPPPTDVSRMKNYYIKEQKVFGLIREILAYLGFLWMLLLVAYGQRDPNSYYLNKHIEHSFTSDLEDVCSYKCFFTWANTTLINNLYGSYPGFVTDGNSKLVGTTRLRQLRVKRDSCPIVPALRNKIENCRSPYSLDTEDMGHYEENWNVSSATNITETDTAWSYQNQSKLRGYPTWGKRATYRGGGYVAHLGNDRKTASRVLQDLFSHVWLDTYTRAVFVEFTIYNANVNLFCIVKLIFETNALGAFFTHSELQSIRLYPFTDGLHIFVVAAEVIYYLFIIYYMVVQGKLMKEQKWGYFRSKWNLLELAIIIISWSALSVFVKRTILGSRDISHYQKHKNEFVSFNETAVTDAALGYLIAFLVLLSTIKLWHLLRLNPKLNMITATLQRAWGDISGFIIVIVIMFLAYSVACNVIFGWKLQSYKTLFDSAKTMVSLQLGIFNYEEVLDYNPILGSFLVGSCIIFMTFVVMNLFISVILVAFTEEQKHHQASDEEEIVDLMLMKICSFFGLRHKKEETDKGESASKASAGGQDN
ncbi:polycystic kidney disease 1-like 2 [Pelobates cultripes]|uniref:Polycystic kidney disease 1-like 2 n=1 Tax=Pelobates cultripes TaxID=61616 RepID=A0AAD1TEF8_PELCU|nr:polycystic kidney disease 1-like 2 [Pelobates cultripes]